MSKENIQGLAAESAAEIVATIELTQPIVAHGEETRFLEFRAPTGKDIMACGAAFTISADEAVRIDYRAVGAYVTRLAKVPKNSVEQMSPRDLNACAQVVMGFFQ